ncbi:MAG: DUF5362 family protein [Candidatus Neomarinimicrobiota bacterium]
MNTTETILPSVPPGTQEQSRSIPLDNELRLILLRLVFWGRIVGIMNMITGTLLCLALIALIIPAVVVGVFLIVMGSRLLSASSHFRNVLNNPSVSLLSKALHKLRSYIFLNGLLLILLIAFVVVAVIWILAFGSGFWEIWNENINHFVLTMTPRSA